MPTYKPEGCSAYLDTFNGLIPCKVIGWADHNPRLLTVKVTRTKGPYRAGEIIHESPLWTPPKDRIRRREYSTTIMPYRYERAA